MRASRIARTWAGVQARRDPGGLVFLDETGTKTNMARTHGRAPRGQRLQMSVPHGHWHTSTVIAGLTLRGMIAPCVLDGPMNRAAFGTYVERVLVPELRPGDIVTLDNLPSHKGSRVRNLVRRRRRRTPVPAALQPRLQPDRARLLQAQGPSPQGRRAHRRSPLGRRRPRPRHLLARRMPQLLQGRRIRSRLIGLRTKGPTPNLPKAETSRDKPSPWQTP